jgi:hypothetical protein
VESNEKQRVTDTPTEELMEQKAREADDRRMARKGQYNHLNPSLSLSSGCPSWYLGSALAFLEEQQDLRHSRPHRCHRYRPGPRFLPCLPRLSIRVPIAGGRAGPILDGLAEVWIERAAVYSTTLLALKEGRGCSRLL